MNVENDATLRSWNELYDRWQSSSSIRNDGYVIALTLGSYVIAVMYLGEYTNSSLPPSKLLSVVI